MKKMTLSSRYLLMVAITIFSSACSDPADPDTKAPTVVFDGLIENQVVRGTVSATIQATDNDKIDKVDVFIDGNLLTTLTTPPYELTWNTDAIADGNHVVKIVATDKAGNETAVEVTVSVKNLILTAYVPQNKLATGQRGFIFLSDETGKFISGKEYANGETVVLKEPTFQGDKFYLTEATIKPRTDGSVTYNVLSLETYPGIARGEWKVTFYTNLPTPVDAGNANLTFTNAEPGYYYGLVSNGVNGRNSVSGSSLSVALPLLKSPSKLLIMKINSSTGAEIAYRVIPQIVLGSNASINLATVSTPMATITTDNSPNTTNMSLHLYGYPKAGDYSEEFNIGNYGYDNPDGSPISIPYPGTGFPSYYFDTYLENPNYFIESGSTEKFDLKPFTYTFETTFANDKINYTATGNYDYGIVVLFDDVSDWIFFMPTGTGLSIPIPALPSFISAAFSTDFSKASNYKIIFDEAEYTDYGGMVNYLQGKNGDVQQISKMGTNHKRMYRLESSTGGRLKTRAVKIRPSLSPYRTVHP